MKTSKISENIHSTHWAAKSADVCYFGSQPHCSGYMPLLSICCMVPLMTGLLLTPESAYPFFPLIKHSACVAYHPVHLSFEYCLAHLMYPM